MFSTLSRTNSAISAIFNLSSANAHNLDQGTILSFGKALKDSPLWLGNESSNCLWYQESGTILDGGASR